MARKSFKQKAWDKVVDEFWWYFYYQNKLDDQVKDGDADEQWHRAYSVFFAYVDIDLLDHTDFEDIKEEAKAKVERLMDSMKSA